MKKTKKIVAAFLCVAMLFGISPHNINFNELITFKAYAAEYSDDYFVYDYEVDSAQNATITGVYPLNDTDTLNIPESIDGYTVVSIDHLNMDYDYYKSIVKVVIPSTVKTVSEHAFEMCPYVTQLTINSKIWDSIYVSAPSLKIINITSKVETIDSGYISSSVPLDEVNYDYAVLDNIFSAPYISLLNIGENVEAIESYFDTKSINEIYVESNNQHFSNDSNGVLFNKEKTILYNYPGKSMLEKYVIPDGVKIIKNCFSEDLTEITISNTVTAIDSHAFSNSPHLETVYCSDNIESIGSYAFGNCPLLKSVVLPDDKPIMIDSNTFDGTLIYEGLPSDMADENIIWDDDVLYVYNHAVASKENTAYVIMQEGTKSIANSLFSGSETLESVYIPNSVGYLGSNAFENCIKLSSISIPGSIKTIGSDTFSGCSSLKTVKIRDGVETIENQAFKNCSLLERVEIPDSVKSIYYEAFANCTSLTDITFPETIESLGNDILSNTGFYNNSSNWSNGSLYNNKCLVSVDDSVYGTYTIKSGTKQICAGAFQNATNVNKVAVPSNMTAIPAGAFGMSNIEAVDIPSSVTRIEESAFYGCKNLKEFIIPESITYIGRMAFAFCPNLKSITIPETVKEIAVQAFGYSGLESVTLPYGVTEIGGQTFYRCENLENITATGSLKSVGFEAFYGCNKLSSVNFEGTEAQWNRIFVDTGNEKFTNAEVNFVVDLSISLTPYFTVLSTGKSATLTATVLPEGASDYTIEWSSGNKSVATVNSNGVVTGISEGFATIKATIKETGASDSCIIFVPPINFSGNFDFSEINMATNMSKSDPEGTDSTINDGGNSQRATAYLARWDGAVLEENDKYPSGGVTFGYNEVAADYHVQEVLWLPDRTSSLDNNTIKQAIIEYGAVYASFGVNYKCFNSSKSTYYLPSSMSADAGGHAIAIVGWDDNYSKNNFIYRPKGNGAFICKNSWSTDSGEDGYFYISYYDSSLGIDRDNMAVFNNLESKTNYNKIYQYDPLGAIGSYSLGTVAWGANVFPENGRSLSTDEELCAVSFYTYDKKTSYEVYVVDNYTSVSSLADDKVCVSSGVIDYAGYHTVTFEPVSIKAGTRFAVVVKLIEADSETALALEYPIQGYSKARANRGESFYSYNGSSWYDVAKNTANANVCIKNANVCIKAFTDTVTNTNVLTAAIDNDSREYESDKVYTCEEAINMGISVNPEYVEYVNRETDYLSTAAAEDIEYVMGSVPSPIEIGNNDVYYASGISFPSYYSLVDEECVTPVKDQGNYGTCWTFASYASLESCLLKKGKGTTERSEGMSTTDEINAIVNASSAELSSFEFDSSEKEVILGEVCQLTLTANPIYVDVPDVIWKSSNPDVVSVNSNGMIIAKTVGSVTITATEINGDMQATCNITVKERTYTVTWIVDGAETNQSYKVGDTIVAPSVPTKNGYTFVGWTPSVPVTMPEYDLSFTAVFEKIPEITVEIRLPSTTTISYGDSIILHADITRTLPAGAYIDWTVSNDNFSRAVSNDGTELTISPNKSGSTTITATVYDKNGNIISSDEQVMTSKAGFFDKIIAFFKKLFGLTKTIPQIYHGTSK